MQSIFQIRVFAFLFVFSLAALPATLTVTVKDASGGAVAGADVRLRSEFLANALGRATKADGSAVFADLADGKYTLRVQHDGFADHEQSVDVKGDVAVTVQLKIAAVETSV